MLFLKIAISSDPIVGFWFCEILYMLDIVIIIIIIIIEPIYVFVVISIMLVYISDRAF